MDRPTILFFSRDPGGSNQVVAAYRLLERLLAGAAEGPSVTGSEELSRLVARCGGRPRLRAVAKDFARDIWARAGIVAEAWEEVVDGDGVGDVARFLEIDGVAALVTATSNVDDRTPQILWQAAARLGLPALALVGHSANPRVRFLTDAGDLVFPDRILAAGEEVRAALVGAGVPADRVVVTGALHLAEIVRRAAAVPADRLAELRRYWGVRNGERIVLFASECGAEMAERGLEVAHDEFACLDRLIRLLRRGAADFGPVRIAGDRALVVIRPHPKDRPGKYDAYTQAGPAPRVVVDAGGDGIEAVLAVDAVAGMDSSLLYEAEALGKPALSLVPGHRLAPAFVADLEPGSRQR